nr:prephenate dehydrogenase [Texcoconibacillus texcoconensis]
MIIGLGLIGGSLALAIKKEHADVYIYGYDIDTDSVSMAQSLKVIDEGVQSIEEAAAIADLLIISTPVVKTMEILEQLQHVPLKSGALITDVGSTKKRIMEKGRKLENKDVTFIGGHPMAGSHKTGVTAAKAHLFENAYYVITPDQSVPTPAVIRLQNWLKGTRARFLTMLPEEHDQLAGVISHFPHVIAASLVRQVEKISYEHPQVGQLAAGGFRDITRIASSSPTMWRDICVHNKEILLELLQSWQKELRDVTGMIESEDEKALYDFFSQAKTYRDELPSKKRGALPAFYDLYVDVPDHPGVISDVTGILAEAGISITNIRIIETREDIMGVLRLSFRSESDLQAGKQSLNDHLYETYVAQ